MSHDTMKIAQLVSAIVHASDDKAATSIVLTGLITKFLREREAAHYLFHKKCEKCIVTLMRAEALLVLNAKKR